MLVQFGVHFILIIISTAIPLIYGECNSDARLCFKSFSDELDNHLKQKFESTEIQFNHICHQPNGLFYKFVECIKSVESHCHSDNNFKQLLCNTRTLKMKTFRFNWKANFFYQLCHNPSNQLSLAVINHENCISDVFNNPKWKCDFNYFDQIRSIKRWKDNITATCSLWQKFRECAKKDVKKVCGEDASLISDHLFHNHQSYFEKYYTCKLDGVLNDQCWYDLIIAQNNLIQTSTTQMTNDVTESNISSNKSANLMTFREMITQTQTQDISLEVETLKDTTDPNIEGNHQNPDQSLAKLRIKSEQKIPENHESGNRELNESIQSDNTESNDVKTSVVPQTNGKNTEKQTYTSGAATDSISDKYLLIIPILLVLIIKLFI